MTDTPNNTDRKDIEQNKYIAAIGYLFFLCLVPLILKQGSKFAQFHGKQGLVLTIAAILWWLLSRVLSIIPILGWLVSFVGWVALIILAIMGVLNAAAGKYWKMPFLGQYADQIKL